MKKETNNLMDQLENAIHDLRAFHLTNGLSYEEAAEKVYDDVMEALEKKIEDEDPENKGKVMCFCNNCGSEYRGIEKIDVGICYTCLNNPDDIAGFRG